MTAVADALRTAAKGYELNALAYADQGDARQADGFTIAALIAYELANAIDEAESLDETEAA